MAKPKLTLTAGTAPIEGGAIGTYLITLDQAAPVGGLTVNFNAIGSTATINNDYSFVLGANLTAITANSFTILAGATTATLNLVANADAVFDPNETVVVNLTAGTGYGLVATNTSNLFAPKVDYAVQVGSLYGVGEHSIGVGDFNNDGILDIAIDNRTNSSVSVLMGNATGFDAKIDYAIISNLSLSSISVNDFNNDGKLDLAITGFESVSVLLRNSANNGFDRADYAILGSQSLGIKSGDFNNDGKLDLVTANGQGMVSVLLRNSTNTGFNPKVDYTATEPSPFSVSAGDFNNDGKLDLVVPDFTNNVVSVLMGNATGFDSKIDYATGSVPVSVTEGDFNGDGKLDLVVANNAGNSVSVLLRNSTNSGFDRVDYAVGVHAYQLIAGDFNNDGKLDVAVTNNSSGTVSVLLRNTTNTGFNRTDYTVNSTARAINKGDFNNDGKLDLVVTNADGTVSVLLNKGITNATLTITDTPTNTAAPTVALGTTTAFIEAKDIPSTAVNIDSTMTITDDGNTLATAKVVITGNYVNGQDVLIFHNDETGAMGNIVANFNSIIGKLDLQSADSTATIAQWQTALQAVKYLNTSDTPDTHDRTISVTVNDGALGSTVVTKTVTVAATNDTPTFKSGDGIVTTRIQYGLSGYDAGYSVTVQTDSKILVAGHSYNGTTNNVFALTRYNTDGSLDTSFDTDGKVTTPVGSSSSNDIGQSVTIQADGKILVAGQSDNGSNGNFALVRYNSNGSLDLSFDTDGKVTTPVGSGNDGGQSVTVQTDGKILVAGYSWNGSNYDFALVRYHSDGSLDLSFDTDGKVTTAIGSNHDIGQSVTIQADGKILVAGSSDNSDYYSNFALTRYNTDGSLDTNFGIDGKVTTAIGSSNNLGQSVTIQADGKILVAGVNSNASSNTDFALVRYYSDGSLDTSFGTDGKVTTAIGSDFAEGHSITVQTDGKILVAGYISGSNSNSSNTDFALVRYNSDGSLDTSFDTDGKVTTAIGSYGDLGYSVTMQVDGKILVSGVSDAVSDADSSNHNDFAIVRYNSDGSLDTTFDEHNTLGGIVSFTEGSTAVVLDSNVNISDVELDTANNYNGASVTLVRHGGANSQDVFSGSGALTFNNNAVVLDTVTVGSYTQANGQLVITFNANASNANAKSVNVDSVLQHISYSNTSNTPPTSVQIDWIFNDGNTGAQGVSGALIALGSTTVNIIATDGITGTVNNDSLIGTAGNDTINGLAGADTMKGGLGNDTYVVDNMGDVVTETSTLVTEIDTVYSSIDYTLKTNVENLILTGTKAINGTGNTLKNTLTGNTAANILNGGTGADTLIGDLGNDVYVVDNIGDVITETSTLATEIDSVNSSVTYTLSANVENLTLTGAVAISGTGNELNNVLTGNAAINTLNGGAGADTLIGGLGNDVYVVDDSGDVVTETSTLATEIDRVNSSISYILGDNLENLTLTGTALMGMGNALNNTLTGNAESNVLNGGAGADKLIGGLGNDVYFVDNVGDVVTETSTLVTETDSVNSSVTYTLTANVEYLSLIGGDAINGTGNTLKNFLFGNAAANILNGGTGADTLMGGFGNDVYVVDNIGDVIDESSTLATEIDSVNSSVTYTLSANVENITLTGVGAISGTGNELNNILTGNNGANTLNGGIGVDTLIGGLGNDVYVVDNSGDVIIETSMLATEIDRVESSINYTLGNNLENLTLTGTAIIGIGNALNNALIGNAEANTLDGGAGADKLTGGLGNDVYFVDNIGDVVTETSTLVTEIDTVNSSTSYTLKTNVENLILTGTAVINGTGNTLDNVLTGNDANNSLTGGAGADTLTGLGGADTLIGGLGKDTYQLTETIAATDTVRIAAGDSLLASYDTVNDFKLGVDTISTTGVDKLDLVSITIAANTSTGVNGLDSGSIHSHSINNGIISFGDTDIYTSSLSITATNLADVLGYLQANITLNKTVAFVAESSTFVFQDGGVNDTLIELVGVTASSVNTTGLGVGAVWIM